MKEQLEAGAAKAFPWDVVSLGRSDCHSYMPTLVVNGALYPIIDNIDLFALFLKGSQHIHVNRHAGLASVIGNISGRF
ncbi:MAG: hypothetical protein V7745_05805 [Pseudomonadales bacterium]